MRHLGELSQNVMLAWLEQKELVSIATRAASVKQVPEISADRSLLRLLANERGLGCGYG